MPSSQIATNRLNAMPGIEEVGEYWRYDAAPWSGCKSAKEFGGNTKDRRQRRRAYVHPNLLRFDRACAGKESISFDYLRMSNTG